MYVSNYAPTNKDVLYRTLFSVSSFSRIYNVTDHVWVFQFIHDRDVLELDVQELVHALEGTSYRYIVLELNCDFVVDEGLEEAGMR